MTEWLVWLGIAVCLSQSAALSGLNLAVFSLSRLRLESAADGGDADAARVLALRRDANLTLVTILWANVSVNVLLTLLAESVLAGVAAFLFSTVAITFFGEIFPQAWFTRNAKWVAARLAPLLRAYRIVLWPIAKPTAKLLDAWIGPEAIGWLRESELRDLLEHHASHADTDLGRIEAIGAVNFLALDDIPVGHEGEPIDPRSTVRLPFDGNRPRMPSLGLTPDTPFLRQLAESGRKWAVLCDEAGEPHQVANVPAMLRDVVLSGRCDPYRHCHRPLIVRDPHTPLGRVLSRLTVEPERASDDVVDKDLVLVWADGERRIITGSDILGRLLHRIAHNPAVPAAAAQAQR
jgi:metal transporter CNNM